MDDDFNTANAISVLFDLAKHANYYLQKDHTADHVIKAFIEMFDRIVSVLGFSLGEQELLDQEIEDLIEKEMKRAGIAILHCQIRSATS